MDKQEAIKRAYGKYWKDYGHLADEDGFIFQSDLFFPDTEMKKAGTEIEIKAVEHKHKWSNIKWRPKSLSGIENNNGWTKIESEDDLPKTADRYYVKDKFREDPYIAVFEEALKEKWLEIITHYRSIEKPKPPIY
jgi:hypothetical protein